jgi:hypothetical protein
MIPRISGRSRSGTWRRRNGADAVDLVMRARALLAAPHRHITRCTDRAFSGSMLLFITDVPLPLPVEAVISADDLAPRVEDRMLVSGGVVYLNSEEAALAYPKLWRDGNTVRVARHRDRERHGRDWQVPPGLERYAHRRAINGAHNAIALVDQAVVADPHAHLRAALGELAFREAPLQAPQPGIPLKSLSA